VNSEILPAIAIVLASLTFMASRIDSYRAASKKKVEAMDVKLSETEARVRECEVGRIDLKMEISVLRGRVDEQRAWIDRYVPKGGAK
jgi:hypothetical protein